jgi:hypothetical protein
MMQRMSYRGLLVAVCVLVACGGKKDVAQDRAAPVAPLQPADYLDAPPGYAPVAASPPLLAAWEAKALPSGFTPTLRLAQEPASSSDATQACNAWRDSMFASLQKTYGEARKLGGSDHIEGGAAPGCLLIALVMQPTPGGKPLALLAYGAAYPRGGTLYTLAALTGTTIDEQSGDLGVRDLGVLKAMGSFRSPRPAP